ncbi:enoyl-CoA hydratase-related protein [Dactylosporangium sp. NPDC005572]|uniref:enoyl-CoA hydratase/isomerase family protein n=1 Tax=Dactylosporangium sp. NPDC005572 TaxID=3156889 RepID=UPI0033A6A06F
MSAVAVVRMGPTLTLAEKERLLAALRAAAADDAVRAVVLTGTGTVFSRGQDLRELDAALRADPAAAAETVERHYNPITLLLATMPKPVIAAVNGTCAGAGLGFALACDLQVWSATATLATAFTKVGLTCDSGLSATLARAVGHARASALVLLAEPFTVEQALAWGFAGDVVAPEEVEPRALALAARLAGGPAQALAASKRLLAASAGRSLPDTLRAEAAEQAALGVTPDHAAAVAAFTSR